MKIKIKKIWGRFKRRIKKFTKLGREHFYSFLQGPVVEFFKLSFEQVKKARKIFKDFIQLTLGYFVDYYINFREKDRVWTYRLEQEKKKHGVIADILKHSKWIAYYLVLLISLSFFLDWLFWEILPDLRELSFFSDSFVLPARDSVEVGLEIFIGAISAVLGLIFALYTVGVQLTNDRYSEKVSDFINQESVSDYFFSFLIFTDLYALLVLLKLHFFPSLPFVSFIIASVLVALSLLGIPIFKTHYINSLKPLNLFRSLWRLCREEIQLVTSPESYKSKSWSLAVNARNFTNRHLDIFGDLFRDLVRNDKWDDASYAPLIIGRVLRDYVELKKLVDEERGWWFFERYEQVKAEDLTLFTIKANYELQGKGPLHIPKAAKNWLEKKGVELLEEMMGYIPEDKSNKLAKRVSDGYKHLLVGTYEERRGQKPKLIPGAIHNQEFEVFSKGLESYFPLWKKIDFTKLTTATNFLNDYFAISQGLLDEWDINKALSIARSFYRGNQLNDDKQFSLQVGLPTHTRNILLSYWERLEVEQKLEGRIITPKSRFVNEIEDVLVEKHKEILVDYLGKFFDNSDEIILSLYKQKNFEYAGQFIKMQYEWVSRLLHLGDKEIAGIFAKRLEKNKSFIAYLPKQVIIDLELLEQAEKGLFVSLTEKVKPLFKVYVDLVALVLVIVRYQEKDQDKSLRLMKLPIIWGGVTYLVSELEQDHYYIATFILTIEKTFKQGWMVEILEKVSDLKLTRNIWWETTRYHSWYALILNKMRDELTKKSYQEPGAISFREVYDHPSSFVRNLANWDLVAEERCVEGFLEWLKKREEIKKVIYLIMQKIRNDE